MGKTNFIFKCINDTAEGLCDGLSHFSGPSRVALIYMIAANDAPCIYDPQRLLRGHEPILEELYLDRTQWLKKASPAQFINRFGHCFPEKNLQLTGLISYGSRSKSVFYQMWFTEQHPDMCAIGPTERWLEHAAWRLSHDVANEAELYTGISGSFLREYAHHAVRDHIVDQMNIRLGWDTPLRIFPTLDAILGISKTREEGAWPRGRLIFVESGVIENLNYVIRFPIRDLPLLINFKHVRKLLQAVECSPRVLVSDSRHIVGMAEPPLPSFYLAADFCGQYGYVSINEEPVCSFSDGCFSSTTHRANLVQVEEALLESDLNTDCGSQLLKIVTQLVHNAQANRFGCTLVIDLNDPHVTIAGHTLEQPLDLQQPNFMALAESLTRLDGALHICGDLKLHGFACLLDGHKIANEDRSRGARFNSALRFTKEWANVIVVVVSSDHPVSVIREGLELSAQCEWYPHFASVIEPQPLVQWINESAPSES